MDLKELKKNLISLGKLEGSDFLAAVDSVVIEFEAYIAAQEELAKDAVNHIKELEKGLENTNAAKLDADLAIANKKILELKDQLGLGENRDAQKIYFAKNLLRDVNCLHFPGGRMIIIQPGKEMEISLKERNSDYYKGMEKAKMVSTIDPAKR